MFNDLEAILKDLEKNQEYMDQMLKNLDEQCKFMKQTLIKKGLVPPQFNKKEKNTKFPGTRHHGNRL